MLNLLARLESIIEILEEQIRKLGQEKLEVEKERDELKKMLEEKGGES